MGSDRGVKINQAAYLDLGRRAYRPDVGMWTGGDCAFDQDSTAHHTAKSVTKWIQGDAGFPDLATVPEQSGFEPAGLHGFGHFGARSFRREPRNCSRVEVRNAQSSRGSKPRGYKKVRAPV